MLPLGPGPIPRDSQELSARLESGIRATFVLEPTVRLTISSALSSVAEITSIDIDASGAAFRTAPTRPPARSSDETSALIRRVGLTALPASILGVPVNVIAELEDVTAKWSKSPSGEVWLVIDDPETQTTRGLISAKVRIDDLERGIRTQLQALLSPRSLQIQSFELQATSSGTNEIRLLANAMVGVGGLSAPVTASGTATVDANLDVSFSGITLTSTNPLAGLFLATWAAQLQVWNGRVVRASEFVFSGVSVQTATVEVGSEIQIRATFA